MSVPDALARGRAAHDGLMVDSVTVTRETRGPLDETTGLYPVASMTVYAGPGRIKAAASRTVDVAGAAAVAGRPELHLPWAGDGASGVRAHDRVSAATGPLAGASVVVVSVERASSQTCRRFVVEVIQ